MSGDIDYAELRDALARAGSTWGASQAHGLIAASLAAGGVAAVPVVVERLLEGTDPHNAFRQECAAMVAAIAESVRRDLAERLSGFDLMLPDDDESSASRTAALADWCEGYLHGLVGTARPDNDALRERLARDPAADIIGDMLQMTRAASDDSVAPEDEEAAFVELVEYLRVAAQLIYEDLADLRPRGDLE